MLKSKHDKLDLRDYGVCLGLDKRKILILVLEITGLDFRLSFFKIYLRKSKVNVEKKDRKRIKHKI